MQITAIEYQKARATAIRGHNYATQAGMFAGTLHVLCSVADTLDKSKIVKAMLIVLLETSGEDELPGVLRTIEQSGFSIESE